MWFSLEEEILIYYSNNRWALGIINSMLRIGRFSIFSCTKITRVVKGEVPMSKGAMPFDAALTATNENVSFIEG